MKERRIGLTCWLKLIYTTIYEANPCRLCVEIFALDHGSGHLGGRSVDSVGL
jgi:hypothetical protein